MKLSTRTTPLCAAKHRSVERLADHQIGEVHRGNPGILNRQFTALGEPGSCGGQHLDGAAWAALVVLPSKIGKSAGLAELVSGLLIVFRTAAPYLVLKF